MAALNSFHSAARCNGGIALIETEFGIITLVGLNDGTIRIKGEFVVDIPNNGAISSIKAENQLVVATTLKGDIFILHVVHEDDARLLRHWHDYQDKTSCSDILSDLVAVGKENEKLKVYAMERDEPIWESPNNVYTEQLCFVNRDQVLSCGADIVLSDLRTNQSAVTAVTTYPNGYSSIAVCGGKSMTQEFVTGDYDGRIKLWDIRKMQSEILVSRENAPITSICFVPSTHTTVAGCDDGCVKFINKQEEKTIYSSVPIGSSSIQQVTTLRWTKQERDVIGVVRDDGFVTYIELGNNNPSFIKQNYGLMDPSSVSF